MKNWFRRLVLVALFIAPGLAGPGTTSADAAGHAVPFKGSFSGTAVFGGNGAPVFTGAGNATHMGRITNAGYVVFTNAPVTCAGGVPNDNYETLTAANGDSFTLVSHDVACPTGPNQYQGSGAWEVVQGSGTGRFQGVIGQGTLDGHSDFGQGVFDIELAGTLTEP
jgi:hypothetical protein